MKQLAAKWKRRKSGELVLKWKRRKVQGVHYCPRHGGQEVGKRGLCVVCVAEGIHP